MELLPIGVLIVGLVFFMFMTIVENNSKKEAFRKWIEGQNKKNR